MKSTIFAFCAAALLMVSTSAMAGSFDVEPTTDSIQNSLFSDDQSPYTPSSDNS